MTLWAKGTKGLVSVGRHVRRAWPVLRFVFGLALGSLALWALSGHADEVTGFTQVVGNLQWWWLPVAVAAESASYFATAGLQYRLLAVGGLSAPVLPLVGVTLATQAINDSLPAGTVLASVYTFRWYRRFGADGALAAWALVGSIVASVVSLALVAVAGLALATGEGASLDLIPVLIGVLAVTLLVGALFVYERLLALVVGLGLRLSRTLTRRPRGDVKDQIARIVQLVSVARLTWRDVIAVVGWGLANWLLDCGCFAVCFLALGSSIPLKGLLLAYGAGQLAANLPITPGGLGAVEGSITFALVAFGGALTSSVNAVLVYRLISFWGQLAVGALCGAWLTRSVRHGRWPRLSPAAQGAPIGPVLVPAVVPARGRSPEGR